MKTVYFVRHGETEGNRKKVYQSSTIKLSEKGRSQAATVAERVSKLPIDSIVSSPMERAKETAAIIAGAINKKIVCSDLFAEFRRPSEQRGKPHNSPEALAINDELRDHFHDADWHHSDEENFNDLNARAKEVLLYLVERPEEHLLVVTHGFFLRVILARALLGENLSSHACQDIVQSAFVSNSGLTVLTYGKPEDNPASIGEKEGQYWQLRVWNDHAHLG